MEEVRPNAPLFTSKDAYQILDEVERAIARARTSLDAQRCVEATGFVAHATTILEDQDVFDCLAMDELEAVVRPV